MAPRSLLARLTLILVAVAIPAGSAAAEVISNRSIVLVAGDDATAKEVQATAVTWLSERGWPVWEKASEDATSTLVRCLGADPAGCTDLITRMGARRVWFFHVTRTSKKDADMNVALHAYGPKGNILGSAVRPCSRCQTKELKASVGEALAIVSRGASVSDIPTTILRVETQPPGAIVQVGMQPIGKSPIEYAITPGKHRLAIVMVGYDVEIQEIEVADGELKDVEVVLRRLNEPVGTTARPSPAPAVPRRGRGPWPYLLGTAGVAALVGGATLFAIRAPSAQDGALAPRYRETRIPAVLATAAGGVLIGWSAYLFRRPLAPTTPMPVVSISGGGAWLGLAGEF